MHRDQCVDAGDLEHAGDARVDHDEVEPAAVLGRRPGGRREDTDAGRVEECAPREVDHDLRSSRPRLEGLLEARRGRQVEIPADTNDEPTGGRRFRAYVKIARRDHGCRV